MPFSIMNGLSSLGTGVAAFAGSAGLELQKSQLAQQTAILADQLATARETALEGQRQTFQSGENLATRTATATNIGAQIAAENARNTATNTAAMEREQARLHGPTDMERLFDFLKINPDGTPKSSGGTAPSSPSTTAPDTSGGTSAPDQGSGESSTPPSSGTSPAPSGGSSAPSTVSPFVQDMIAKATGQPVAGSEDALRRGINADVNKEAAFKYKTAGERASETERRVQVAKGLIGSEDNQNVLAAGIASYQLSPLDQRARQMAGGPDLMAKVMALNPAYQEGRYPEIAKAMAAFGPGVQGDKVRFLNVGVQHLDVFDQAAQALKNPDNAPQVLNALSNTFQSQFGVAAPTTFDGLKQIVATEIEKSIAGGIGSSADRDRLMASLSRANSPAQLQAMTDGYRMLMAGQLNGLKSQYEDATDFKTGPFAFDRKLAPATIAALSAKGGSASPPITSIPDTSVRTPQEMYGGTNPAPAQPSTPPAAKAAAIIRYDASGNRVQ